MGRKIHPLPAGFRFGRWTVLGPAPTAKGGQRAFCRCDCGVERIVYSSGLSGRENASSASCGCFKIEQFVSMTKEVFTTHGMTYSSEYSSWSNMIDRCENPNNTSFPRYGARGIRICESWRASFESFYRDMGPKPSPEHSIERIHNDRDYSPENCKWGTRIEQNNNQRPRRKAIPDRVKQIVLARQQHKCICGEIFSSERKPEFDHRPALILRDVDYVNKVYIPDQNDPEWIDALHKECHLARTIGRLPNAAKTVTTLGSDIHLKSKFKRLESAPKPKKKIMSRGFSKESRPFPKVKSRWGAI